MIFSSSHPGVKGPLRQVQITRVKVAVFRSVMSCAHQPHCYHCTILLVTLNGQKCLDLECHHLSPLVRGLYSVFTVNPSVFLADTCSFTCCTRVCKQTGTATDCRYGMSVLRHLLSISFIVHTLQPQTRFPLPFKLSNKGCTRQVDWWKAKHVILLRGSRKPFT